MSDLRTRIAAIIDTHTAVGAEGQVTCWCDSQKFDGFHAHSLHAADAVIRELSLMIDDSYRISYGTAFIVHGYYETRDDE